MNEQKPYRILICDSNVEELHTITQCFLKFIQKFQRNTQIYSFTAMNKELQNMLQHSELLDIVMIDTNFQGEESVFLAQRIREKGKIIPIVFLTDGTSDWIKEDFLEVSMINRPVRVAQLNSLYQYILEQVELKRYDYGKGYLKVIISRKRINLKMHTIISFEKIAKKVIIQSKVGQYATRDTISAMEQRLPDCFLRISQSVIVNLNEVTHVEGQEVFLSSKECFTVGRTNQGKVKDVLNCYCKCTHKKRKERVV